MHIANVNQILFVLRVHAEGILPFVNQLKHFGHGRRREHGRSLGKAAHKLVEEVLGRDL